ncbi:MAG: response regulator [Sedimentisphaerales bacterium]|nr:response regulator [Sedimentisphaerales bacterium]
MDKKQQCVVLMVEDDPGDQKLMRYALAAHEIPNNLQIMDNAEEALAYLDASINGDEGKPRPDLILLDLNMPGMGGKDFLKEIKSNKQFCDIPVVIVSTSDAPGDIEDGYRLHAAGYVQKRLNPKELRRVIEKLANYWFVTSCLVKDRESMVCDSV